MTIRFDGQVVIVTGAGRGLGAAYARLIASLGGAVVVHDAGVAQDGSGFDPSIADGVASAIVADGGIAAACHENLDQAAACRRRAPEMRPELVAPGVAFLASAACQVSGVVLQAAGGRFSAARWNESHDVDFGSAPASVDDIAARWGEIVDFTK